MEKAYAFSTRVYSRYYSVINNSEISSLDERILEFILNDEFEKDSYFNNLKEVNSKRLVKTVFRK